MVLLARTRWKPAFLQIFQRWPCLHTRAITLVHLLSLLDFVEEPVVLESLTRHAQPSFAAAVCLAGTLCILMIPFVSHDKVAPVAEALRTLKRQPKDGSDEAVGVVPITFGVQHCAIQAW